MTLHLVPTAPAPALRPEARRRTAVDGRRPRIAVVGHGGSAALDPDHLLRLARVADVRFVTPVEAAAGRASALADVCIDAADVPVVLAHPAARSRVA